MSSSSSLISSSEEVSSDSSSSISNTYYAGIDFTKTGAELKTDLFNLINPHTSLGYKNVDEDVYQYTDSENGYIIDIYSSQQYSLADKSGSASGEGSGWNKEHIIPQSLFSENEPMRGDVFHVYPTDCYVNNRRSNYPHATVNTANYTSSNNTKVGTSAISYVSTYVCEPNADYKGDIARTYFYFVTCYQNKMSSLKDYASFEKNTYPSLSSWAIELYKQWSDEDPVDEKEIKRNEEIYKLQKNRNPFIDYPGLEDSIWE